MKSIFFALALTLGTSSAFAMSSDDGSDSFPEAQYYSWCDGTKVMSQDSNYQAYVKYDCADAQKTCEQYNMVSRDSNQVLVMAACSDVKN